MQKNLLTKIVDEDEAKTCLYNETIKLCVEAIVQGFLFHCIKWQAKAITILLDISTIKYVLSLDVF